MDFDLESAFYNTADYEISQIPIGQGAFGTVYIAENRKDHQKYACKIINIGENFNGHDQMLFMRESLILQKLDHPSIVKFYGINFQSFQNSTIFGPSIITEYLRHGSLKDILNSERNSIADCDWTPTKKYICLIGIANAMRYLHQKGILHRDLKPENILIDENYYPRVSDFGLSRCFSKILTNSMKLTMTGKIGTPMYMAPELLRGEERYGASIDVYAFGILAYEIATGIEPYSELGKISSASLGIKIMNGYRPKIGNEVSGKMKDLILKCLSENDEERPSFDEIFSLLSNDFDYSLETVDEDEINEYIENLSFESKPSSISNNDKQEDDAKVDQSKERKCYEKMIESLLEKVDNIDDIEIDGIFLIQ